jgi:hypothetical protein
MPQIVVRALTHSGIGAITLAERPVPAEQHNDRYIAQLIERVRWALSDAEQIESQTKRPRPRRGDARRSSLQ